MRVVVIFVCDSCDLIASSISKQAGLGGAVKGANRTADREGKGDVVIVSYLQVG